MSTQHFRHPEGTSLTIIARMTIVCIDPPPSCW